MSEKPSALSRPDLDFNAAVTGLAALLDKVAHLARLPGGGDALTGLSVVMDGAARLVSITYTPSAATASGGPPGDGCSSSRGVKPPAAASTPPSQDGLNENAFREVAG